MQGLCKSVIHTNMYIHTVTRTDWGGHMMWQKDANAVEVFNITCSWSLVSIYMAVSVRDVGVAVREIVTPSVVAGSALVHIHSLRILAYYLGLWLRSWLQMLHAHQNEQCNMNTNTSRPDTTTSMSRYSLSDSSYHTNTEVKWSENLVAVYDKMGYLS